MKKTIQCGTMVLSLFVGGLCLAADSNADHNHHAHNHHTATQSPSDSMMMAMHTPMQNAPFHETSNLEYNFIANMIPHHEGAIQSAKILLQHSSDAKMKQIAQEIINVQQKEVDEFRALLAELQKNTTQYSKKAIQSFNKQAKEDMDAMHHMMMKATMQGDINADFLRGMIPHHEGAIKAAKQILQYTKNEKIKTIANDIIATQEKEIKEFEKILKQ